jgi:hypothetical protein
LKSLIDFRPDSFKKRTEKTKADWISVGPFFKEETFIKASRFLVTATVLGPLSLEAR